MPTVCEVNDFYLGSIGPLAKLYAGSVLVWPCACDDTDPSYALVPYSDAAWLVPNVCDTVIYETINDIVMNKAPFWGGSAAGPYPNSARLLLSASATTADDVVTGNVPVTDVMEDGSFAVATYVNSPTTIGIGLPVPHIEQIGIRLGLYGTVPGNIAYAWFVRPDLGSIMELYGTTVLPNNADHHIAVTWDNTTKIAKLIVNNVLEALNQTTFEYTGNVQTFNAITTGEHVIEAWGAQGGPAGSFLGAKGGYIKFIATLTAGVNYEIRVGGQGTNNSSGGVAAGGGYNGGGHSYRNPGASATGGGGGGMTDIRPPGGTVNDIIGAAAGGGGAGNNVFAADGGYGGPSGTNGTGLGNGVGGGGGTTSTNGASGGGSSGSGGVGTGGVGWPGGSDASSGGGGAGLRGGGGGYASGASGNGAGGGGGANAAPGAVSIETNSANVRSGHGRMIITRP